MTFGNVILSENEKELLKLGPDFMVVADIDKEEFEVEAGVTMTKSKVEQHVKRGRRT